MWMNVSKLKLNESKIEFFVAASPYYEKKIKKRLPDITLAIGNSHIKPSQLIRNLGAYFDSNVKLDLILLMLAAPSIFGTSRVFADN